MDIQRLGLKLFLENESLLQIRDFIPLFHSWIQQQSIQDHLLIDVHDYSHVFAGPGILLVAHEGNFSMDLGENRPGLFYYRKLDSSGGSFNEALKTIFQTTLRACKLIEDDSDSGKLQFRTDKLLIVVNDRLHAPNNKQTLQKIQPKLSNFLSHLLQKNSFELAHHGDSKERFAVMVKTQSELSVQELLHRIP